METRGRKTRLISRSGCAATCERARALLSSLLLLTSPAHTRAHARARAHTHTHTQQTHNIHTTHTQHARTHTHTPGNPDDLEVGQLVRLGNQYTVSTPCASMFASLCGCLHVCFCVAVCGARTGADTGTGHAVQATLAFKRRDRKG